MRLQRRHAGSRLLEAGGQATGPQAGQGVTAATTRGPSRQRPRTWPGHPGFSAPAGDGTEGLHGEGPAAPPGRELVSAPQREPRACRIRVQREAPDAQTGRTEPPRPGKEQQAAQDESGRCSRRAPADRSPSRSTRGGAAGAGGGELAGRVSRLPRNQQSQTGSPRSCGLTLCHPNRDASGGQRDRRSSGQQPARRMVVGLQQGGRVPGARTPLNHE